MKKAKIVWGFYLVIISMFILMNELDVFQDINILKLLIPVVMLPMFLSGIIKRGFLRILAPITITLIVFSKELYLDISPWILALVTILLGIGLDLLFPKKKKVVYQSNNANIGMDMNRLYVESKSGSLVKYIDADDFTTADINVSCSSIKLYFDKSVINPRGAVVNFDTTFSKVELYLPRTWHVVENLENTLSTYSVVGNDKNTSDENVLTLQGKVKFANIKVIYV